VTLAYDFFSLIGKHDVNQDAVLAPLVAGEIALFGVADGVGGSDRGEVASRLALSAVEVAFQANPRVSVSELFRAAKETIDATFAAEPELGTLSTTLTVCIYDDSTRSISLGHVGDCRVYHLSGAGIATRTKDQTEAQRLVDEGVLRPNQVAKYGRRNVLTSAITPKRGYNLFSAEFSVSTGDRLVMCSDGMYSVVRKREIVDLSHQFDSNALNHFASALSALAEGRVPSDDCTALLLQIN
jgi:PPM family protein phosphatase